MENSSKALVIAGAILVSILVIVVGNYIFNSSNSTIKTSIDDSNIDVIDQMYLSYEGIQMGTNVPICMIITQIRRLSTGKSRD